MSYHINEIKKGVLGEYSKVQEELAEYEDACAQGIKVMAMCELADLIGAIEALADQQYGLSLDDLIRMKDVTRRAFLSGRR